MKLFLTTLPLIGLLACQQPFGTDRHDLEGFRVAALAVQPLGDDAIEARCAVVLDDHLWHDQEPVLTWYWTEANPDVWYEGLELPETPTATGFFPSLSLADAPPSPRLVLVAAHPGDNRSYTAFVDLPSAFSAMELTSVQAQSVDEFSLSELTAANLHVDARSQWATSAAEHPVFASSSIVRLGAEFSAQSPQERRTRWMILGKAGTFFELNADSADWLPAEVSVDDEDITVEEPISDGLFSGMVLALDDQGNNDFRAFDWWLGTPTAGLFTNSGRWLSTDQTLVPSEDSEPALIQGTLTLDDQEPSGVRLEETTLVEATELSEDDPYGTLALGCSHPTSGPFEPTWLLEGRCTRTQIQGATVIVQGSLP